MFPEASLVVRNVEDNRKHWVHIGELLKIRKGDSTQGMSLDQIISIEEEYTETEGETQNNNNNNSSQQGQQVNGRWYKPKQQKQKDFTYVVFNYTTV